MLEEKFQYLVTTLNISDELIEFSKGVTVQDMVMSGVNPDDIESSNEDIARLACAKMLFRLYDMSKGYTVQEGNVYSVCKYSNCLELPITKASKLELLKQGRIELKDLYGIAMNKKLYDATELLIRLDMVSSIRYRKVGNRDVKELTA